MKKIFLAGIGALLINGQVLAQAKIAPAEVSRIVKTLTADDMNGRKVFTPGLDRAAAFILGEFKKAGLQPLPGEKSMEQLFNVYEVVPVSSSVTFDNANIPSESSYISTRSENVQWQKNNPPALLARIEATDNMGRKFQEIMRSQKSGLVIIDPAHAEMFKRYKNFLSQNNIKASFDSTTVVFVVSSNKNPRAVEVRAKNQITTKPLKNIVGYLPGKSRPQEYVVFSAHYDHIGILEPINGDSIANGADDDASGTTAVVMLANYFKKQKNTERSLVFVAFTAEEIGGYGSQYFSKQLDPQKVTAMFNIEMIGKESQFGKNAGFITGFDKSDFGRIVQQNLAGSKYTFHPDPYVKENLFYRSDNATLARLGVPAHTISTDKIDTDKLYHSVDDEFESLDVTNMTNIIEAIAQGARSIVAGKDTPTLIKPEDVE
jgi:hypothetical protein